MFSWPELEVVINFHLYSQLCRVCWKPVVPEWQSNHVTTMMTSYLMVVNTHVTARQPRLTVMSYWNSALDTLWHCVNSLSYNYVHGITYGYKWVQNAKPLFLVIDLLQFVIHHGQFLSWSMMVVTVTPDRSSCFYSWSIYFFLWSIDQTYPYVFIWIIWDAALQRLISGSM